MNVCEIVRLFLAMALSCLLGGMDCSNHDYLVGDGGRFGEIPWRGEIQSSESKSGSHGPENMLTTAMRRRNILIPGDTALCFSTMKLS
jgi:hypothetical protein